MRDLKYPKPVEDYIREGLGRDVLEKEFGFETHEYYDDENNKTLLELVTDWPSELTVEDNEVELVSDYDNAVRFVDTGKGKVVVKGMPFDEDEWYKLGEFRGKIVGVNMKSVETGDTIEMKIKILIECEGNLSCLKSGEA